MAEIIKKAIEYFIKSFEGISDKDRDSLAKMSEMDKEILRYIKTKNISNLHAHYQNRREQINPLIERIGLFGLMIDRNHLRLSKKKEDDLIAETYSLDKMIEMQDALENPRRLITKIDEYKNIISALKNEENRLSKIRDELADKVDKLITIDDLTKLYRKEFFKKRAIEEIARAMRTGEGFLILMSDIDHFGEYNDTFGHIPAGDEALKTVARVLSRSVREGDIGERHGNDNYENEGGRQGGEEFVYLIHGVPKEKAHSIVDRVRKNVESTVFDEYNPLNPEKNGYGMMTSPDCIQPGYDSKKITTSIGYLTFDPNEFKDPSAFRYSTDFERISNAKEIRPNDIFMEMMRRIDAALYVAKGSGRNNVKRYDPSMEIGNNAKVHELSMENCKHE
ncbi:hypothetical protein COV19_02695 [Candidatus Woesearchaeota archaeon CG10_big_fil_rev_8_21_14_0_10_44_13]|nr:MAG: hypothetical protein COV19_02695 [Candidatus Woesearchaeota archaeon CG10_big_fil_rev_8_21_14_0_10_44_13]